MANLRHPFQVIQEAAQGLDPGQLGRGYGQAISDRLTGMGFNHTFDGLDRFKFDGSGGIDPRYGTIDAIRNKGYVYKGTRGPESQALVFQPFHDKAEARALGMNPDGPSRTTMPVQMRPPQMGGGAEDPNSLINRQGQNPEWLQQIMNGQQPGAQMRQPMPSPALGQDPSGMGQPPPMSGLDQAQLSGQAPMASQEPWFVKMLRGRR